jgi:hypothetical protein
MKTCIITCGRLENRYAVEWVEYYKQLGFDHIFIADNNHDGEEYFEEVLQSYIDENFVTIYNYRNWGYGQFNSYMNIYYDISNNYDWILLCDFDEFLELKEDKTIQEYLSRECFNDKNQILINWKIYTDNDLVYDDGRGCLERFTTPMDIQKFVEYDWMAENSQIKPILKGGLKNIIYTTPHVFSDENNLLEKTTCNNCGKLCKTLDYWQWDNNEYNVINYDLACIKHFTTKTIDEWVRYKIIRGAGDRDKEWFDLTYPIERFFKYNNITEEKLNYLKEHNIDISNINKDNCEAWLVEGFLKNKN